MFVFSCPADVSEEYLHPEQQEWSFRGKKQESEQPYFKEEEQEAAITEFPFPRVIVKSEDDDEQGEWPLLCPSQSEQHKNRHVRLDSAKLDLTKPRLFVFLCPADIGEEDLCSERQGIKEEERETELTQFPLTGVIVKIEGDGEEESNGEHCGGSQKDGLLAPLSDSPDTDDEHSPRNG